MRISEIYEGWKNQLLPPKKLKAMIGRVSRNRRAICNVCAHHSMFHNTLRPDVHCTLCLCTLIAKTKCLSCYCPDDPPRWGAILTDEQEEEMKNEDNEGSIA